MRARKSDEDIAIYLQRSGKLYKSRLISGKVRRKQTPQGHRTRVSQKNDNNQEDLDLTRWKENVERSCRIFRLVVFQPRCQSGVVIWRGSGLVVEVDVDGDVDEDVDVEVVDVKVDVWGIRLDPT